MGEIKDQNDDMVICSDSTLPALDFDVFAMNSSLSLGADWPWGAPIQSCGKKDDHFQNFKVSVDPPKPVKGKDLTITIQGDLDEDVTSGILELDIDLVITHLVLKMPVKTKKAVKATSGIKAVIGPLTLPNIRGIPNVKGSAKMTEQNGEEIFCANFNLPVSS